MTVRSRLQGGQVLASGEAGRDVDPGDQVVAVRREDVGPRGLAGRGCPDAPIVVIADIARDDVPVVHRRLRRHDGRALSRMEDDVVCVVFRKTRRYGAAVGLSLAGAVVLAVAERGDLAECQAVRARVEQRLAGRPFVRYRPKCDAVSGLRDRRAGSDELAESEVTGTVAADAVTGTVSAVTRRPGAASSSWTSLSLSARALWARARDGGRRSIRCGGGPDLDCTFPTIQHVERYVFDVDRSVSTPNSVVVLSTFVNGPVTALPPLRVALGSREAA